MSGKKVLFVELNELSKPLLDKWIDDGSLPNFAKFRSQSKVYETTPDVDDSDFLEPWIQWYSIHTGLPYEQHKVFHLTDGERAQHLDIWQTVAQANHAVGCFSSMNARPFKYKNSFYVADPWCEQRNAWPALLNSYNDFVGSLVREHTQVGRNKRVSQAIKFASYMLANGLSSSTVIAALRQLIDEKRTNSDIRYQRVAIQDRLQFDAFKSVYKKTQPTFATFFSNSCAHLQHAYWKYMEPEKFNPRPPEHEIDTYQDAIKYGYQQNDRLLGELVRLADESNATVFFLTALSQHACPPEIKNGDKAYFRCLDVKRLLQQLGISAAKVEPTMTHQYNLSFHTADDRSQALTKLRAVKMGNIDVFAIDERNPDTLYFNCQLAQKPINNQQITTISSEVLNFSELFYQIPTTKNGRHFPNGSLWIRTGKHEHIENPVSILDIFPTVLNCLGIPKPHEFQGTGKILH